MSSILVTGAGGLIGRRVADAAAKAGHDVTRLVRRAPPGTDGLERDLRRPLEGVPACDWMFHLAGGYAGAGRRVLRRADLRIARNLMRYAAAYGVKNWVFASAAEVYGVVRGIGGEDAPLRPVIPYGEIKRAIEAMLVRFAAETPGSRVVILRIGEVYGREARLVGEIAARLKRGFCPWPGSGRVPASFVHVDDVAQAFLLAAERAPPGVSIYNVADDEPATWRAFLHSFSQMLGVRQPVYLPRPLVEVYALGHRIARCAAGREAVLTRPAVRLLTTPKALSNARIARELGLVCRYPNHRIGLEAVLNGLSHDAQDGAAQTGPARAPA